MYFFEYEAPRAGVGHFIHTYERDGSPLPSFEGEPRRVALTAPDAGVQGVAVAMAHQDVVPDGVGLVAVGDNGQAVFQTAHGMIDDPFGGEPRRVALTAPDAETLAGDLWLALNSDNRVSLFVRYIDLETGDDETSIINKHWSV